MNGLIFIDLFAVFFFSFSGTLAGMKKGIDWFGILFLGFITSMGGSSVRDLFLGMRPVWISSNYYILMAILGGIFALVFREKVQRIKKPIVILDTLGISFATIAGVQKSLAAGAVPVAAIFFGIISAIMGGILRDIIRNEVPIVFRRELYASACLAGATVFCLLFLLQTPLLIAYAIGAGTIVVIRYYAVKYQLYLPSL